MKSRLSLFELVDEQHKSDGLIMLYIDRFIGASMKIYDTMPEIYTIMPILAIYQSSHTQGNTYYMYVHTQTQTHVNTHKVNAGFFEFLVNCSCFYKRAVVAE